MKFGISPKKTERLESVHLSKFPVSNEIFGGTVSDDPKQLEDWATLLAVREHVLKSLEEARNEKLIGVNLGAQVTITAPEPVYSVLVRYKEQLRYLFIVSAVMLEAGTSGNGNSGLAVKVSKADGRSARGAGIIQFTSERIRVSRGLRKVQSKVERNRSGTPCRSWLADAAVLIREGPDFQSGRLLIVAAITARLKVGPFPFQPASNYGLCVNFTS